jgi:hypothetical protein
MKTVESASYVFGQIKLPQVKREITKRLTDRARYFFLRIKPQYRFISNIVMLPSHVSSSLKVKVTKTK